MLTISQLANYVGITPRTIRHYHAIGLVNEPVRNASGYRLYDAQAVIDFTRIKTLTNAGVPLSRIPEFLHGEPSDVHSSIDELDRQLQHKIAELQSVRRRLVTLAQSEEMFLPASVITAHQRLRALGVSERGLQLERDGWLLCSALYPELIDEWVAVYHRLLDDPEYGELYLLFDQCFDWDIDDPRIEELAHRALAFINRLPKDLPLNSTKKAYANDDDPDAYQLIMDYSQDISPAWTHLMKILSQEMESFTTDTNASVTTLLDDTASVNAPRAL